jgi:hypothetical protein
MWRMRTRLVLAAAGLAAVAGAVVPAVAAPTDPVPTGPCTQIRPSISVTNVDTRVTVACTTVVIPVVLPHDARLVSAPAAGAQAANVPPICPPKQVVWISGGNIYVQVGCFAPIVIPIPLTGPPPGLAAGGSAAGRSVAAVPPPCPVQPLVRISGNNLYITVGCLAPIVIPIPITGPPPGLASAGSAAAFPPPCPSHPLFWFANGNLYIQQGCLAPIVIPLPGIKPPPTA